EAERRHPLLHARQRDRLGDLAMKQRDDFLGRSSWNDDGEPRLALYARIARFRHGWYVRQGLRSHLACYRQRAQLAFLTCGAADTSEAKAMGVWPATVEPIAKPELLNGICTRSRPSDSRNCSPTRCAGVPVPAEAKLYLPGLDLMKPTRSLTV